MADNINRSEAIKPEYIATLIFSRRYFCELSLALF